MKRGKSNNLERHELNNSSFSIEAQIVLAWALCTYVEQFAEGNLC